MTAPAYVLAALLLVAIIIIVYQFKKLSRAGYQHAARPGTPVAGENKVPADRDVLPAPDREDDLKSKLISLMAHNCRGALNNVISLTGFYEQEQIGKEQFKELVAELRTASARDLDAIENTLKWLRTQLRGFECNLLEINASCLIRQSVSNNISVINRKKISLTIKDDDDNWAICGDIQLLEFVMSNLVNNAVKYSHPGGDIECVLGYQADSSSGLVRLEVIDHGVGMTEETQKRVFCHDKTIYTGTSGEKGAGIALAICQDFVKMQGGKLEVSSVPDKGTVFSLVLPGRRGLATGELCGESLKSGS